MNRPAYSGPVDNPQRLCACGHRADDHWRGTHTCMFSTQEKPWECACYEFTQKATSSYTVRNQIGVKDSAAV